MGRGSLPLIMLLGLSAACAAVAQQSTLAKVLNDYGGRYETDYKDYYDKGETSHICMRMTTVKKCDIIGFGAALTYEAGLQCCNSNRYGHGGPRHPDVGDFVPIGADGQVNQIGKCTWRLDPYLFAIIGTFFPATNKDPRQIGTFSVTCDFNKGSEECGDGLCDDLRLKAEGPVWWVPKAAVTSLPRIEGTNTCADAINNISNAFDRQAGSRVDETTFVKPNFLNLIPRNPGDPPPTGTRSDATKKAGGAKAQVQYNRNPDPATKYYEAQVMVAYGHVEIKSKHTGKKFDEGFLEANLVYVINDSPPAEVSPDTVTYIAEPYRYDLTLKSSGSYDKY